MKRLLKIYFSMAIGINRQIKSRNKKESKQQHIKTKLDINTKKKMKTSSVTRKLKIGIKRALNSRNKK